MKKKDIIKIEQVEEKILMLRGVRVIAVKNNPKKFPKGYIIRLDNNDLDILRSKFLTAKLNPKSRYQPQAYTERGLYMLATALRALKRLP